MKPINTLAATPARASACATLHTQAEMGHPATQASLPLSVFDIDLPLVTWRLPRSHPATASLLRSRRLAIDMPIEADAAADGTGAGGRLECELTAVHEGAASLLFVARRMNLHEPHDIVASAPAGVFDPGVPAHADTLMRVRRCAASLAKRTGLVVGVAAWDAGGPAILAWEGAKRDLRRGLPDRLGLPVLESTSGLVLAALLPEALTRPSIDADSAARGTPMSPAEVASAYERLAAIRRLGFAALRVGGVFVNVYGAPVNSVSVPLILEHVVLALTVIGSASAPIDSWTTPLVDLLVPAARELTAP